MAEVSEVYETSFDRPLERRLAAHRSVAWQHGLVGGLVSGVVMGLFLMVVMAIRGDGFLRPLELIGSVWYGAGATGTSVILVGLVTHFAVAAILGLVWAFAFSYVKVDPIISGLVYGGIVWAAMQYLILPFVADSIIGGVSAYHLFYFGAEGRFVGWMVLAAYLIFGAGLGVFEEFADRRRLQRSGRV